VVDELDQLISLEGGADVLRVGPVAPAVGRLDDGGVLVAELLLLGALVVVEELEEQHPCKLRDAVGVGRHAGVLAQLVADSLDQRVQPLLGRDRLAGLGQAFLPGLVAASHGHSFPNPLTPNPSPPRGEGRGLLRAHYPS
jgi:hypothetical protein